MDEAPSKLTFVDRLRHTLLGKPIPTAKAHQERLSPAVGLPVFSSDSLSSVAYATEAILSILILKAVGLLHDQIWISLAIVGLIWIVAASYRQTIFAYPSGGGSYIVASDNLGEKPGLVAGAALLIDYILTVSVSIAAGVAAIRSAFPSVGPEMGVALSILLIFLVAWANLRGVRESGVLFSIPTYGFVVVMLLLVIFGIMKALQSGVPEPRVESELVGKEVAYATTFIVLRAFAAGCTALTGIEAVSNGVQAFRAPEAKNAAKVLVWMASLLGLMFLGIGYIALHLPVLSLHAATHPEYKTVTAQIAAWTFGDKSFMFYAIQAFTAAILILAANTAYADFPRLAGLIARDGYLPRYMNRQGDRLVFHNGIIVLAVVAAVLVYYFKGELDGLLPLYAVGVFTAFTLSQSGMVVHWFKLGWRQHVYSLAINFVGAVVCAVVLVIIAVTKFHEGAWLIIICLPLVCMMFIAVKKRYASIAKQLEIKDAPSNTTREHIALLLVPRVNRGIANALDYAESLKGTVQAVHVTLNEKKLPDLQREWRVYGRDVPLVVLPTPFRSLVQPVVDYVDEIRAQNPEAMITVIVAEAVSTKWYQKLLSENVTLRLRTSLQRRKNVIVATVRYFLD